MPMFQNAQLWLYGLFATMIGGAAGAVSSGLGSMLLDPKDFNLYDGFPKTLKLMGICGFMHAILNLCTYLKQSPLPPPGIDVTSVTKTQTVTISTPVATDPPKAP